MGEAVLPSLIDAFEESRKRFAVATERIADVGCGTGRFMRYLSRFGGTLTGIDRSAAMLRLAGRRLAGTGAHLVRMDLRELQLPQAVQTLTCTFDTLNYLTDPEDLQRAFRAFARALEPGGTLLFDVIPQGANRGAASGRQRVRIGPIHSEWRVQLDPGGRGSAVAILLRNTRFPDRAPAVEIHRQRWHPEAELRGGLAAAGFEVLDWRPAEPGGSNDWVHVVARRRDPGEGAR